MLGQHLRAFRIDSGRIQRDIAETIGVTVETLGNWEFGRTTPGPRYVPRIIALMGHDPRRCPSTMMERLLHYAETMGLAVTDLAGQLGVDPSTLSGWLYRGRTPSSRSVLKMKVVLGDGP